MIEFVLSIFFIAMMLIYLSWIILFLFPASTPKIKKEFQNGLCNPKISIIIPAHNEEKCIGKTIESILNAKYDNDKEIIVVNDGSKDKTEEIVKKISETEPRVKILNIGHGGKANAINKGAEIANNEFVVILDADSRIDEDALNEIIKPFSDNEVGATSGIIRAIDNKKNPLVWFQDFEYVLSSAWRFVCNKANATYILPGFAAFRKEALKKVSGFSTDTFSEDFEIGLKLKKVGFKLEMTKAAIYTQVPQTLNGLIKQRMRWGLGTIQVIKKHYDIPFSKKFGAVGLYGIPTQLYWYVHGLVVLPITFYQIFGGYYEYFAAFKNFFSFEVLKYFFGWLSTYGMLEYSYKTFTGEYGLSTLFYFVLIVFCLNLIYNVIAMIKISKFRLRYLFVIFFFFPYSILVLSAYIAPLFYELKYKNKVINKWEKSK